MTATPVETTVPVVVSQDNAAIELTGVTAGYGASVVIRDASLRVDRGEMVGIVGPSGSGKTTLLRLVTGQADVHAGVVRVLDRPLGDRRAPRGVGYVPQIGDIDPDFPLTVEQVVLFGGAADSRRVPWFSRAERRRAVDALERLGIVELARRRIGEVSGGQRQRAFLARALARQCDLLLLDEPTSGVDLATRRDVLRALGDLHSAGLTVVLTTHDLNFVASHLPRIACLSAADGALTADGPPARVLTPTVLERTYGTPMRVIRDGARVVVVDGEPVIGGR